eukprot:jgi/Chrzof1/3690/Cz13g05090.t1
MGYNTPAMACHSTTHTSSQLADLLPTHVGGIKHLLHYYPTYTGCLYSLAAVLLKCQGLIKRTTLLHSTHQTNIY